AQTDADLVPAAGTDRSYSVRDASAPGGVRQQTWHFPSRVECMVCHSRAANFVLGLSALQMNKVHDYAGVQADQLGTLQHLGVFPDKALEKAKESKDLQRRLVNPYDTKANLDA